MAKQGKRFGDSDTFKFPIDNTPPPTPAPGKKKFTLRLRTDNWGEETSWVLTSDAGDFEDVTGSGYDSYTTYREHYDLPDGSCHTFKMMDSFGDGIYYGGFDLRYGGEPVPGGSVDGNFGWSSEHQFGDCSGAEDLARE
jgi:hypothetical protein